MKKTSGEFTSYIEIEIPKNVFISTVMHPKVLISARAESSEGAEALIEETVRRINASLR